MTKSLWQTEFTKTELEQQNKILFLELNNRKLFLRCANRSRVHAELNAGQAVSKLEISACVTSDLFAEKKEVKEQLDEATTNSVSLQSELLESIKTNNLFKQKLDKDDIDNEYFQESLKIKTEEKREQSEIKKLEKQLQVMGVDIGFQRAEAIQLIQFFDGKQYGKFEKCVRPLLTYAANWD